MKGAARQRIGEVINIMNNLGKLENVHKVSKRYKIRVFTAGLIFLALGMMFTGLIFVLPTTKEEFIYTIIVMLMGGLWFLIGIAMLVLLFRQKDEEVSIYENGLIYSTGKSRHTIKWEEIESIKESVTHIYVNGVYSDTHSSYTIKQIDGSNFILRQHIQDLGEIGERLKTETFKRRLPIILEKLAKGETVDFGTFTLNQNYVASKKGGTLPLANIGKINIENGKIRIFKKDNGRMWGKGTYSLIQNAPILLAILKRTQ